MPVILLVNTTERIVVDVAPGRKIQKNKKNNLHYVQGVVDDLRWIIAVLHDINNRWEFVAHHQIVS